MKYQKKQEIKKRTLAIIALLMAIIMAVSLLLPFIAYAAPEAEAQTSAVSEGAQYETAITADEETEAEVFGDENFTVELSAGFDDSYIVLETMPVRGVVTNNGSSAFSGELQIKAYTGQSGTSKEYALYYQRLELEGGASKKIDMEAAMGNIHRYIDVMLVTDKGETLYKNRITLTPKDPRTVMVGILSDRASSLNYLNGLPVAYLEDMSGSYREEMSKEYNFTVYLDEGTFPASTNVLDGFAAVIIDDYDITVLSEEQQSALKDWIIGGGTVLVATGELGSKTWKGFQELTGVYYEGAQTVPTSSSFLGITPLAAMEGENLTTLTEEQGQPLFSIAKAGNGNVVICHYALSQAPMQGQEGTILQLQEALRSTIDANGQDRDNTYDPLSYISENFPALSSNVITVIFACMAAYIVIVGPALYFVLKKRDKREKGWVVIPAVSVIFMVIVFALSQGSDYKNGMMNVVSYVTMEPGTTAAGARIGISLKAAGKGETTFSSDEVLPVNIPMTDYYYYDSEADPTLESCKYRVLCGDRTEVTFSNDSSWNTRYISTEKNIDMGGNIESTIELKGGRFVGEIINNTNVDFYTTSLILGYNIWDFGELPSGESISVDVEADAVQGQSWSDYRGEYYTDLRTGVQGGTISRSDAYLRYLEEDLRDEFYSVYQEEEIVPMAFFGFSDEPVLEGVQLVNGKTPAASHITMYHQGLTLDLSKQESFEVSLSGVNSGGTGNYDTWNSGSFGETVVYAQEDCDVFYNFNIPKGVEIDKISLTQPDTYSRGGQGICSLFNNETSEWDVMYYETTVDAAPYIDGSGAVNMSMRIMAETDNEVPRLRIEGRGLNAGN